jgi:cob(I)alamin adenosyltransferase
MVDGLEATKPISRHDRDAPEFVAARLCQLFRANDSAAERARPDRAGLIPGSTCSGLNRLSDLAWVLARAAEQGELRRAMPSRER